MIGLLGKISDHMLALLATTTGNVARSLLFDRETREVLLELVPDRSRDALRQVIKKNLRVISSTRSLTDQKINDLELLCKESYKLNLTSYPHPRAKLSPSVHKLLGHTWELIRLNDNKALGSLSEGGIEACNKLLRRYCIRLSRKRGQYENLFDCQKRLWVHSDPVLEQIRLDALPFCSVTSEGIPPVGAARSFILCLRARILWLRVSLPNFLFVCAL